MKFEKPKSSIERVVGASLESEEKILKEKAELFDEQIFNGLKGKEREKNEDDLRMITIANLVTNDLRRKYGMDDFDIPAKNFHIIPEDKWIETENKYWAGVYRPLMQGIAIKDKSKSKLRTLSSIIHETLHFKSYNALQLSSVEKSDPNQEPILMSYRIGLEARSRDGKEKYFSELNEAMTEELSKRILVDIYGELRSEPMFEEEILRSEKIIQKYPDAITKSGKRLFTSDTIYAEAETANDALVMIGKRSVKLKTKSYVYKKQRRMLNSLIDKVWNKHKDIYKDQEKVFDVFAKAYMTGNLLTIGRLIEDTFGEGTFRKIGELNMRPEKKEPPKSV